MQYNVTQLCLLLLLLQLDKTCKYAPRRDSGRQSEANARSHMDHNTQLSSKLLFFHTFYTRHVITAITSGRKQANTQHATTHKQNNAIATIQICNTVITYDHCATLAVFCRLLSL